ncbi:MAG TPA: MBL fold metallo-hydrolase [Abditibacterium sp.]|jgi:L-ascorbate metabolism protein UlaG (beta-lactamase superfamily)
MRLTFLGHAAFLIQTAGKRIITDPYSSEIGYWPIAEHSDIVSLSHENPKWHSCLDEISGDYEVLRGLELETPIQRGEITFGAVEVFEEAPATGPNAMVWLESEGIRVLHMGDCGFLPADETIEKCGRVDVLLALAGGLPTLPLDDLMVFIEKLQPKIVIPMHFGVPGLQMEALGVAELEKRFDKAQIQRNGASMLEISHGKLPDALQLQVLEPGRLHGL